MLKNKKILIKPIFFIVCFFLFIALSSANPINFFESKDNTLNFVQISDVHLSENTKGSSKRMLEFSQDLLKDAVSQVNALTEAKFVVFSGDVVNNSNKADFLKFISIANGLKKPWYYATGNHDVGIWGGLSKSDILKLLNDNASCVNCNKTQAYHSCDKTKATSSSSNSLYYACYPNKNFLILFMDGVIANKITANGYFSKEQLDWLNMMLKNNHDKKVIIVQHFPVVEPYKSESHNVLNADEYLKIIDKFNNVAAVLSGHYHSTKITQRKNVLHISTPALVEYPNAFREIKITKLKDATKFEIKFIETKLKNVQKLSKSRSKNIELQEGKESDRNLSIIVKNPKI